MRLLPVSGFRAAEQGHLEGKQHLAGTLEGVVSQRAFAGGMTKSFESNPEALFGGVVAERFVVGHY